jgi:O-antigen/teichoic acid export membrane protein
MDTAPPYSRTSTSWNIFFNLLSQAIILGTAFLTTPYIVNKLGEDAYGVIILIGTFLGYLGLLEFGLSDALIRYLTQCIATDEKEKFRIFFWSSIITYVLIGFLGGIILIIMTPQIVHYFLSIPSSLQRATMIAFFIGAGSFMINLLIQPFRAILWAYGRIDLAALVVLMTGVMQPVMAIVAISLRYGVVGVSAATFFTNLSAFLLFVWLATRLHRSWGKPVWDTTSLKTLFRYGGWLTIAQITIQWVYSVDKILTGRYLGPAMVGYYNLSLTMPLKLWIIHGAFASAAFPLLVSLHAQKASLVEVFRIMYRFARGIQLLLAPLVLFLVFFGGLLLHVWINERVAYHGRLSMGIASLSMLLVGMNAIFHILVRAWERADLSAKAYLGAALVYLPILFLLIKRLGILGAALSLFLYSATELFLLLLFTKGLLRIPISPWLTLILNRHLLILAALGLGMTSLQLLLAWPPLWRLLILGGAYLLFSWAYVWFIGFSREERQSILRMLLSRFARESVRSS